MGRAGPAGPGPMQRDPGASAQLISVRGDSYSGRKHIRSVDARLAAQGSLPAVATSRVCRSERPYLEYAGARLPAIYCWMSMVVARLCMRKDRRGSPFRGPGSGPSIIFRLVHHSLQLRSRQRTLWRNSAAFGPLRSWPGMPSRECMDHDAAWDGAPRCPGEPRSCSDVRALQRGKQFLPSERTAQKSFTGSRTLSVTAPEDSLAFSRWVPVSGSRRLRVCTSAQRDLKIGSDGERPVLASFWRIVYRYVQLWSDLDHPAPIPAAMSYSPPAGYNDPYKDPFPPVVAPLLNRSASQNVLSQHFAPAKPVISLWKEQLLALVIGITIIVLGALGLAAAFSVGPLQKAFIAPAMLDGRVITPKQISIVVAAAATLLSAVARWVAIGVCRAWLRRRSVQSRGITIKQWRSLAAGISIRDARKTPLLAGGLLLLFTLAIAAQGAALAGVIVPSARTFSYRSTYGPVVPLQGNGNYGQFISCLQPGQVCIQALSINEVAGAFAAGLNSDRTSYNSFTQKVVSTLPGFLGGNMLLSAPKGWSPVFKSTTTFTPVSAFSAKCTLIQDAGLSGGRYYANLPCYGQRVYYGNTTGGSFLFGDTCASSDNTSMIMDIAVAGWTGPTLPVPTFAVTCSVTGQEGYGYSVYEYGEKTTVGYDSSTVNFKPLTATDLFNPATALIAAMKQESGLNGVSGIMLSYMYSAAQGSQGIQVEQIQNALSNAFAAAATAAYGLLASSNDSPSTAQSYPDSYTSLNMITTYDGYGWSSTWASLGSSVLCILVGLAWLLLFAYMFGGGTRYDPSDWYQTLNTSAGSNLIQLPGTCTGAHLSARKVNNQLLWYGEIGPGHIGFNQSPTMQLDPNKLYGEQPHSV